MAFSSGMTKEKAPVSKNRSDFESIALLLQGGGALLALPRRRRLLRKQLFNARRFQFADLGFQHT